MVITRPHDLRIGQNILQIDRTGLPELFQQPRTLYNNQKDELLRDTMFEKTQKKGQRVFQNERKHLLNSHCAEKLTPDNSRK